MQILKEEIRNNISRAALKEFREKGYEKASMRNIAKSADITVGNMYRYFENKDDLFYSVISPAFEKLMRFIIEQKTPDVLDKESENINIDVQTNRLMDIYFQHKDELLILIDGSKGSKYEGAKGEIVKLLENIIISILKFEKQKNSNITCDPCFPYILSITTIDGVILILKNYQDEEKVRRTVQQFIGFIFKDFGHRING